MWGSGVIIILLLYIIIIIYNNNILLSLFFANSNHLNGTMGRWDDGTFFPFLNKGWLPLALCFKHLPSRTDWVDRPAWVQLTPRLGTVALSPASRWVSRSCLTTCSWRTAAATPIRGHQCSALPEFSPASQSFPPRRLSFTPASPSRHLHFLRTLVMIQFFLF